MVLDKDQQINAAIELLTNHGYKVYKDYSALVGKWVAFWQEGMMPVLHGKIIEVHGEDRPYFKVKCKNSYYRYVGMRDVIEFCDEKADCYAIR